MGDRCVRATNAIVTDKCDVIIIKKKIYDSLFKAQIQT